MNLKQATDLGTRICFMRKEKGLTQQELAGEIFVSKTMVCKYENGTARVPFDVLIRIADLFEVSLDELAGRESE